MQRKEPLRTSVARKIDKPQTPGLQRPVSVNLGAHEDTVYLQTETRWSGIKRIWWKKVKVLAALSCLTLPPQGLYPFRLLCPWDFPEKSIGVEFHFLPFSRGSSQSSDQTWVCWIAGLLFTFWATVTSKVVLCSSWIQVWNKTSDSFWNTDLPSPYITCLPWEQVTNLPCDRYPSFTRKKENV